MNVQTVTQGLCLFADITAAEAEKYAPIVEQAVAEVAAKLNEGADNEANADRLNLLCAACAYYRYILLTECGTQDIKLGDVSVTGGSKNAVAAACAVKDEFTRACADLLRDDGFVFKQVRA